ncbi:MAG: HNH endonuclease signature motif containing protein [Clostridium sp.]
MALMKLCRCGKHIELGDVRCSECEDKVKQKYKETDRRRGSSYARGYTDKWRAYRLKFLRINPICVRCLAEGRYVPGTIVDHIVPHKGDMKLFWDKNNHQALCKMHHDAKTAKEDGGFGNKVGGGSR